MGLLSRLQSMFSRESKPDSWESMMLFEVEWEAEKVFEYDRVTKRLVWSGGFELEITYIEKSWMYGWHDWLEESDHSHGRIREDPVYIEELEREEAVETNTKVETRRAWVSNVPDNVTKTGETKMVYDPEPSDRFTALHERS